MAIQQHYSKQFHSKLSKGTSLKLYQALKYTCLSHSLHMQWQELKNKRRIYLRGNWSNLQKAEEVLGILNTVSDTQVNQRALDNLIEEIRDYKEQADIFLREDQDGWRHSFSQQEYQMHIEAFQFVLDQFGHDYHWAQIPHKFQYKRNCKVMCHYRGLRGSKYNGGHVYRMDIDPTGTYHSGKWYTYGRNSLGWKAQGIPVSEEFLHMNYLIHEVTHAVENYRSHRTRKSYTSSEMNTTLHEFWYARENYPQYFRKLTPVQDGRRNSWWSPVPPLEGMDPEAHFQEQKKAAAPSGD